MNLVIDFHGFRVSEGKSFFKELAIISLEENNGNAIIDERYLLKPPINWENLTREYQNEYLMMYKVHGIPWKKGSLDSESLKSILNENLKKSAHVYFYNENSKEFLEEIIEDIGKYSIIYLNHLDYYEHKNEYATNCKHHKNKSKNNCARDNVLKMKAWILSNRCLVKLREEIKLNDK